MSFKIHSIDDNRISGIEYLPCGAITPKVGMALVQTSGNLALATGTNAPTYISMCEKDSPCTAGDIIPVIRVNKDMIFETTFSAAATSVKRAARSRAHRRSAGHGARPRAAWPRSSIWTARRRAICAASASDTRKGDISNG